MAKRSVQIRTEKLKEHALNISLKEGSINSFSSSISDTYITPFALALKANTVHIGLLNSLIGFIAPVAQYASTHLMTHHSRKKIVLAFGFFQALLWLPVALLAYLSYTGFSSSLFIPTLIFLYMLIAAASGFAYSAWFSWMGDLVPQESRGKYFGRRNMITGVVGVIAVIIGAFILDSFKTHGLALIGFVAIFSLAALFKFVSVILIKHQYSPKFKQSNKDFFSIFQFVKRFDNFGKFASFNALFNLAVMIASPFYSVYMLQDLQFNYFTFMAVTLSSTIFYILFSPIAGKLADKYGNRKSFVLGSILLSLNPFLWMIIHSPLQLILIPQVIVGFANALLGVAITDFTLDSVKPNHRSICISYTNILAGIGTFIGALAGGYIIKYLSFGFLQGFMLVFFLSGILRFTVSAFILPHVKEVRRVKKLGLHIPALSHVHPFRLVHNGLEAFAHITTLRYAEGLKIWNPFSKHVLQEKNK